MHLHAHNEKRKRSADISGGSGSIPPTSPCTFEICDREAILTRPFAGWIAVVYGHWAVWCLVGLNCQEWFGDGCQTAQMLKFRKTERTALDSHPFLVCQGYEKYVEHSCRIIWPLQNIWRKWHKNNILLNCENIYLEYCWIKEKLKLLKKK